jgi:hypothetical protein
LHFSKGQLAGTAHDDSIAREIDLATFRIDIGASVNVRWYDTPEHVGVCPDAGLFPEHQAIGAGALDATGENHPGMHSQAAVLGAGDGRRFHPARGRAFEDAP